MHLSVLYLATLISSITALPTADEQAPLGDVSIALEEPQQSLPNEDPSSLESLIEELEEQQCVAYSVNFLSPLDPDSLLPHATASLPGVCPHTDDSPLVALHPVPIEDFGWVYDFSSNCVDPTQKKKKGCHKKNKKVGVVEMEVGEPWVMHAQGCERNNGENEGLGTCEEGVKRMWKLGLGDDWSDLRERDDLVWVVEGWGDCDEIDGRF
ncbi:hypothetical protein ACMFMF_005325 [Clarireedia jacksonii]